MNEGTTSGPSELRLHRATTRTDSLRNGPLRVRISLTSAARPYGPLEGAVVVDWVRSGAAIAQYMQFTPHLVAKDGARFHVAIEGQPRGSTVEVVLGMTDGDGNPCDETWSSFLPETGEPFVRVERRNSALNEEVAERTRRLLFGNRHSGGKRL